jgi:hypothetical protein
VGVFRTGVGVDVGVGVAICLGIDIGGVGVSVGFCCICASSLVSGCEGAIWEFCRGAHALSSARISSPRRNQHLLRTLIQILLLSTVHKATSTSLKIVTRTGRNVYSIAYMWYFWKATARWTFYLLPVLKSGKS